MNDTIRPERYLIVLTDPTIPNFQKSYWNALRRQWETDRERGSGFMRGDAGRTADEIAARMVRGVISTERL